MLRNRLRLELLEDRTLPSAAQYVASLYSNLLNRPPSPAEVANYVNLLNTGTSPTALASMFANSDEFHDVETRTDYQTLLGRDPSAGELQAWRTLRQTGMTAQQEIAAFLASDEYFAGHGGTGSSWLTSVYRDVLNRAPDAAGQAIFAPLSSQALATRLQAASGIATSPEALGNTISRLYESLLHRQVDPQGLSFLTTQLSSGLSLSQLLSNLAASPEYAQVISALTSDATATVGGASTSALAPLSTAPLVATPSMTATASASGMAAAAPSAALADPNLITLTLPPLDINLLGLEVQTSSTIQVTVSAQSGQGELLGNLLTDVANLLNLQGVNNALNNVLGNVVTLVNSASLSVSGINTTTGPLSTAPSVATTPVLDLFVAPVHLNLLGALVDTTPIHLTITAHSGPGLVLGNVVTDLANLFNPPLPHRLDLNYVNTQLQTLLNELNTQLPGIGSSPTTTPTTTTGTDQVLNLTVPPINVNLLGLVLKTSQIQVNANAITGNGELLGNLLTDVLNTLGATPQNLSTLNTNLNALLGKVVGVLNASSLALAPNALSSLSQVLQTLATPNLVNATGNASQQVLNLSIASTDGTTPPVNVNLLGLQVTTSNIQAQLLAQTGNGQILGNLVYNVANLLNPGGSLNLLTVLNELGV